MHPIESGFSYTSDTNLAVEELRARFPTARDVFRDVLNRITLEYFAWKALHPGARLGRNRC